MSQIISLQKNIYIPSFDENTDQYIDKSPYKPYMRNPIQYECRCRAGCTFTGNTGFKQHIKSKTHKDFIKNYKKYYAEIDKANDTIKELRVENEFLTRKNIKLQKMIDDYNDEFHDCNE
tara:strand:- start:168 stop:524 length:357 start_codon:yes stop_codon:yes gene_type:complete